MKIKKLNAKDYINIGLFAVLYILLYCICGILGTIPICAILIPLFLGILGGIPFILFITKINKFGATTIMGTLVGILSLLFGQSWITIPFGILFGLIADLILKGGNYKSQKRLVVGYCTFSLWVIGAMLPMWIMRDAFFQRTAEQATAEYVNAMMALTSDWMLAIVILLGIVGAAIGGVIGGTAMKKHFQRAGVI